MSQALVNKLLEEALQVADDSFGRKAVDKADQEVRVSRSNLKRAFQEAFSKEHKKDFGDQTSPFTKESEVFNKAVDFAFEKLRSHLEKPRTASGLISETNQQIVFSQPRAVRTPFTIMKKAGIKVINDELKKLKRTPLSDSQKNAITQGTQRLHVETTAGMARLAYVLNKFQGSAELNDFIQSKQYTKLTQKYGDVTADYKVVEGRKGSEYRYKQTVSLYVAAKSKNFAGSEYKDWKKVKPKLEKELTAWIKSKHPRDIAGQEASQSPLDRTRDNAINTIASKFQKVAKVSKKKTSSKPLNSKSRSVTKKAKPLDRSVKTVKATWALDSNRAPSPTAAPLAMITEFNKRLPEVIAKNMQSPALNYRTGRFAESVQVVDVNQTPQGFLSFGYTYQKYPYQTFEPGFAQGSVDRDPRRLIDKSMREIAAQLAISRFYTRRL